jgi:hypothetical protein
VKRVLFLLFLLALTSCANPKYAPEPEAHPAGQLLSRCQARFASGGCAAMEWETLPTEESYGSFRFRIFPETSAPVKVVLWMPSMGHGSSPVTVEKLVDGTYHASKVFFIMHGGWEIRFQEENDEAILPFTF